MNRLRDMAFDSSGQWLAVAGGSPGEQGDLALVRWNDKSIQSHIEFEHEWLTSVCFSPEGKYLAVGSGNSRIMVYQIRTDPYRLEQAFELEGHAGAIMDTLFDATGDWLVSTGSDRSVKIWNILEESLHRTFSHHTGVVSAVDLRPSGAEENSPPFYVATASEDQTVRIWQPTIGRMVRIVRDHDTPLFSLVYHSSGNWLVSGGKDGIIRFIDANSDHILNTIEAHEDWIYSLAFSPDGEWLASGDWSGRIKFHQVSKNPAHEK